MIGLTDSKIADKVLKRFESDEGSVGHKYLETALRLKGARGYTNDHQAQTNVERMQVNVYLPENSTTLLPQGLQPSQ